MIVHAAAASSRGWAEDRTPHERGVRPSHHDHDNVLALGACTAAPGERVGESEGFARERPVGVEPTRQVWRT